jgi:Tripartite tricarboxylate transporter family receptor
MSSGGQIMKIPRRDFLRFAAGAAALPALPRVAMAQTFPSRPVTMIVPFPAGGATDVIGRILAERMRGPLGQPVIIENIGGADGSIGVGRTARARPDGYTICLGIDGTFVLNGAFYSLPYDVLNDFDSISPLATGPIVFVARKTMPAENLNELIAWSRCDCRKKAAVLQRRFRQAPQWRQRRRPFRANDDETSARQSPTILASAVAISVLPRPTTSPISSPPRLFRW